MTNDEREAQRRVNQAAATLESAIRFGADPKQAYWAMAAAVRAGAEALAGDIAEAWDSEVRRIA